MLKELHSDSTQERIKYFFYLNIMGEQLSVQYIGLS